MNVQNATEAPVYLTTLLGGASSMYVSHENMYVTFQEGYWGGNTTIYRIHLQTSNMTVEASGKIPGQERNQYSMDEYGDYFRIQTQTWSDGVSQTNVYVLDTNLSIVGRLEGIAVGENFHSARFLGNRCYLVTFKKIDPLFVIDLTVPSDPRVLGQLKIPGYSDYLHPYDENHIIGVGKETVEGEGGNFAWYQGIKIALFDVSDVEHPQEIDKYIIGDRGSDSPILSDHKAFLFDRAKALLVIPVLVAEIDEAKYPSGVPPWTYGDFVFQGAYVFNISLSGFELKGTITHLHAMGLGKSGYYLEPSYYVERSLYIDNVLYTISAKKRSEERRVGKECS
jgi:inhibitor of cysteine peptidase